MRDRRASSSERLARPVVEGRDDGCELVEGVAAEAGAFREVLPQKAEQNGRTVVAPHVLGFDITESIEEPQASTRDQEFTRSCRSPSSSKSHDESEDSNAYA